jgi:tetratricopeptide (TPR) repeat protein
MNNRELPELKEGDIFYTYYDGQYHLYKLLKHDASMDAYHVLSYKPLPELPGKYSIDVLEVNIYHLPMHKESFVGAKFLTHTVVSADDLIGYHTYFDSMEEDYDEAAHKATEYYHEAYTLTDQGRLEEAITVYSKAIELIPEFFEAIDNRAFCKMDLGRWSDAIEDFKLSLKVNPDSLLAEFSIGECYYRLGEFAKAKEQFEKCVKLDPAHQVSKDFLLKSEELMNSSAE